MAELNYALDPLKLDGVVLLTHYAGCYLGDVALEELFAELNPRKTPVFVHPTDPVSGSVLGTHIPPLRGDL